MDLYFSPATPKRFEKNWIPTVPGPAWFTYLRLYVPIPRKSRMRKRARTDLRGGDQ
jgi:hypothetical protein